MSVTGILAQKGRFVFTVSEMTTLSEVAKVLAENRVGATVVVNDNNDVRGIVSERDIVRQIATIGPSALQEPVSGFMTQKVTSCSEEETIDQLMAKMSEGKFRHLPVIEDNNLVGIVSIGDVVKRKIEQAERDTQDMKRYIAG